MTFERILVGYDGSAAADAALEQALRLRAAGGTLVAVTVCEEGWAALAGPDAPQAVAALHEEAEAAHARAAERLRDVPGAEAELVRGRAADALLALARRRRASLVAVGRSAHGGVGGVLFGDVVATLLRSAPCPLLVAQTGENVAAPPRVVRGKDAARAARRGRGSVLVVR